MLPKGERDQTHSADDAHIDEHPGKCINSFTMAIRWIGKATSQQADRGLQWINSSDSLVDRRRPRPGHETFHKKCVLTANPGGAQFTIVLNASSNRQSRNEWHSEFPNRTKRARVTQEICDHRTMPGLPELPLVPSVDAGRDSPLESDWAAPGFTGTSHRRSLQVKSRSLLPRAFETFRGSEAFRANSENHN